MIESSAHGDEYDGVIFSQLVSVEFSITSICEIDCFSGLLSKHLSHIFVTEFNRSCWFRELKNGNHWTQEKGGFLHKQKSFNSWNCKI